MARIRTIKPEFWSSEQLIECSRDARLLFIGLWNFSDDYGIHTASYVRLKAEVFPADDLAVSEIKFLIDELISNGLIVEYEVDGKKFWCVTGWEKHQKIDKPNSKYPRPNAGFEPSSVKSLPEGPEKIRESFGNDSGIIRERFGNDSGTIRESFVLESPPEGKGREGNGKEEDIMSGKPDVAPLKKNSEIKKQAREILSFLNSKTGKEFRMVDTNLNFIMARLKSGATLMDCRQVIAKKTREWKGNEKMVQYLRPSTLFNATKFEQYVGELVEVTGE